MKLQLSIKPEDRVLEIGPGGAPHERADVFLEKEFDEKEAQAQRGYAKKLKTDKPVVYYKGGRFPFEDNEFDYVICTHVLEYIPSESLEYFVAELTRVAKKGYIEYPLTYYDFVFDFPEHVTSLFYDSSINTIRQFN